MAGTLAPPPDFLVEREQVSGQVTERITRTFRLWLLSLTTAIQAAARVGTIVTLTAKSASIGSTAINTTTLGAGLYRLTFYARVTTAAAVSSSLTVTFGWTESGVSCAASATAMTGNTTTTTGTGTILVLADANTSLTYSTTYASNPGAAMVYRLTITAEQLA